MCRFLILVVAILSLARLADGGELPRPVIPHPFGVNIHFTDEQPGELAQIATAGIRVVRMDFSWSDIEREKGVYDFSAYDRLLDGLERHGLRAMFILDYASPHYDQNRSPYTDEGRAAFARFAAAGAARYKGRGVMWEMYNEPNIAPFWRPAPNVDDYIKLGLVVADAIKAADPEAIYIGPATSGVDRRFLEACRDAGLLDRFDAITVHPYRQRDPETAEADYRTLRGILSPSRYPGMGQGEGSADVGANANRPPPSPLPAYREGQTKPVFSGEWGYSDVWAGMSREKQGVMLARQWLFNCSQGVGLSIWYDWRDDGPDPAEPEHHFGLVEYSPSSLAGEGRGEGVDGPTSQPSTLPSAAKPKPAYTAAKTLTSEFAGFTFSRRLWTGEERDWVLLFTNGDRQKLAVWTTAAEPRVISIPAGDGQFSGITHLGVPIPGGFSQGGRLNIGATQSPLYLTATTANDALRLAAEWSAPPPEVVASIDGVVGETDWVFTIGNPFDRPITVQFESAKSNAGAIEEEKLDLAPGATGRLRARLPLSRLAGPQHAVVTLQAPGVPAVSQRVTLLCAQPWAVELSLTSPGELLVEIRNDSLGRAAGRLVLDRIQPDGSAVEIDDFAINLGDGQAFQWIFVPADSGQTMTGRPMRAWIGDSDARGDLAIALPTVRFEPLNFAVEKWSIAAEGGEGVESTQSIQKFVPTEHPISAEAPAIRIDYAFEPGWKYAMLKPAGGPIPVPGTPVAMGMWVWGDGTGNILRCRFTDAAGQTFQPDGRPLDFYRWTFVKFPLDGSSAGHWGGDKSGIIKYPIKLETLLLIDSHARQKTGGNVKVAMPVLIYGD